MGSDKLMGVNNRLKSWITKNSELSGLTSGQYEAFANSSLAFEDYANYVKESQNWKKESAVQVEKELARKGFKYAYLLYDNNGNIREGDVQTINSKNCYINSKKRLISTKKEDNLSENNNALLNNNYKKIDESIVDTPSGEAPINL